MKVLIVRTSAMGDIVHCLPVLSALRREIPKVRIGWVVEKTFSPLLAGHPDIDDLIEVKLRDWRFDLFSSATRREIGEARRAMRRFAPDAAVDLMGNHKGGAIARASGARRIIGAARHSRREASSAVWINEPTKATGEHAVDRALATAAALLPSQDGTVIDFGGDKILARAPQEAKAFLAGCRRPLVTLQAGAGWGNKTYPADWWGEVAKQLAQQVEADVVVPVAPGEEHLAHAVVAASAGTARSVDAFAFAFLAALLRASDLVLGGDTGPVHLAHALGTPVLCLIGPTDPRRNGPYGAPEQVLWKRLPCSCCYKRFAEPRACLLNLSPNEVTLRALDLLPPNVSMTGNV